jgi:hypothetical protein
MLERIGATRFFLLKVYVRISNLRETAAEQVDGMMDEWNDGKEMRQGG